MRLTTFLAAAVVHALIPAGSGGIAFAQLTLAPCEVPRVNETLRCGSIQVRENRAARNGRMLTLRIVKLPAHKQPAAADPVIFLTGGPGQAATQMVASLAGAPVRVDRDIIFIDARGTNGGHALRCAEAGNDRDIQSYLRSAFDAALIRRCRKSLESKADLRLYTNEEIVRDLEEARVALRLGPVNLWGVSGGTRTALVYLARHPAAVRSLVLAGIAPPEMRNPLTHAAAGQQAFDRLSQACKEAAACRSEFPDLSSKLARVLARLDTSAVTVRVSHPTTGTLTAVQLTREVFGDGLRGLMYASQTARFIPALIDEAARGNFAPVARMTMLRHRGLRGTIAMGSLMAVTCSEDVRRIRASEIEAATRGTFMGAFRVRSQMAACAEWPVLGGSPWLEKSFRSEVPALLLSGVFDPVTPPQWGDTLARHLKNSAHVVFASGHSIFSACSDDLIGRFIAARSPNGLDTSCVATVALPSFATREELLLRR